MMVMYDVTGDVVFFYKLIVYQVFTDCPHVKLLENPITGEIWKGTDLSLELAFSGIFTFVPLVTNLVQLIMAIRKEQMHNHYFAEWFAQYKCVAVTILLVGASNPSGFTILTSEIGRMRIHNLGSRLCIFLSHSIQPREAIGS